MELWYEDAIDLDGEGHFTFTNGGQGRFQFICVHGFMDRYCGSAEGPRVDFSWEGHDEDTPVSGRGWARPGASTSRAGSSSTTGTTRASARVGRRAARLLIQTRTHDHPRHRSEALAAL